MAKQYIHLDVNFAKAQTEKKLKRYINVNISSRNGGNMNDFNYFILSYILKNFYKNLMFPNKN